MCNDNHIEVHVRTHGGELDAVRWHQDEIIKLRAEVAVLNQLVVDMRVQTSENTDPVDLAFQVKMLEAERANLIKLLFSGRA